MSEVVTNQELFERAIATEELARQFYLELSKKFSDHIEIRDLWKSLADDEKIHRGELEKVCDSLDETLLQTCAEQHLVEKLISIEKVKVKASIDKVESLRDAYELAQEIESSEINNLFLYLRIKFFPEEIRKEFVINEIKDHVDKLNSMRRFVF